TLKNTTGKKRVLAGYGIDIDAVAGWLESYGGEDSASDISRASHNETTRLLKLLDEYNIKEFWLILGHSIETSPEECTQVREAGLEIGLHGNSSENSASIIKEQQRDILDKTYKMLTDSCGKDPHGIVARWSENIVHYSALSQFDTVLGIFTHAWLTG
ncbi:polysaccharide deacetylase family protein, partial [Penicillium daleae]